MWQNGEFGFGVERQKGYEVVEGIGSLGGLMVGEKVNPSGGAVVQVSSSVAPAASASITVTPRRGKRISVGRLRSMGQSVGIIGCRGLCGSSVCDQNRRGKTTEVVFGDKKLILDETVGYTVAPCDTVLVTPAKRKSGVVCHDLGGPSPSRRKKVVARKPCLGGPGLKPKTSGAPPPVAAWRVFASTESDLTTSVSSDSFLITKLRDAEVNLSDPFVADRKLTNGTVLDTPNLCRAFMMGVRPPTEEPRGTSLSHRHLFNEGCTAAINAFFSFIKIHQRYTKGVLENRDLKKQLAELQEKYTTLELNVTSLQSDKSNQGNENMTKDHESDQARISALEGSVPRLQDESHWLIATGMRNSFEKVRNSDDFFHMHAGINSLANVVEFKASLKEGVCLGKMGKGPRDDPKHDPLSLSKLKELSDDFYDATFPMMANISSTHGALLSEIQERLRDPARSDP
ncbi:hypothetical protein E3N88_40428 [Mikania micrantha]|uniref:Uncharacterized protein n=1 Tax=Mikania micrantha TaxID=192012 RepID=A0A5N6LNG4_9ASTR|nr:hypothetical protein E3N88_40428 [Mikania micrantha]